MEKLYVHIGLPKTATTTLQVDVFPCLRIKNIIYLGVQQPRSVSQCAVYNSFMESLCTGRQICETQQLLLQQLNQGKSLLISEEMITVSENEVSWKGKLKNLLKICEAFDYRILVTVRESVSAMFSYYTELILRYYPLRKTFTDVALNCDEMKIYHTEYFSAFLKHLFGESRVFFLNFEDIIKGDLSWIPLFFDGIGQISESIMITNNNAKRMTRDVVFTGRKKTLKMAIERNLRGRRKVLFCFFKTRIGRHILKFFNAIPLGEIVLRKPSESEKVYLYKKMRDKAFL